MTQVQKQFEVLRWASLFLEKHQRESRVAEILLQHYLGVDRQQFYMLMREPVPAEIVDKFKAAIEQHAKTGIPVQHLTGYEVFYGREFIVNEHVLIPRPETEELVQHIIQSTDAANGDPLTIIDVGTGSGIIAITLALEIPNSVVYATDISKDALEVAKKNAEQLDANVHFLQGDFLQPAIEKKLQVDFLVSNPPYIAKSEAASLSDTVKHFDPELALFAEADGLAAYQAIIDQAPKIIKTNATLAFEIGHEQGEAVHAIIQETFSESIVATIQDINGKDRIAAAEVTKI
ncbi:peptide chain release factor N(5)-glutamine methyltransferase [Oceanobacillus sp. FSL K6-2867]|uniref:peptide chain release factor N(5)-glutamine methyltransferase n=1 Tax=Oceanobacillus sp. FSL K6-2867 TaxID=2954748 RepID=UPI0030DC7604